MAKHSPSVQTRSSSNLSLLSCWNSSIVASLASLVQPACQRSTLGEPTMMGPKSWNFATKCIARSITHTIIILSLPTFLSAKRGWSSSKYKLFTVSCQIYFLFFFFLHLLLYRTLSNKTKFSIIIEPWENVRSTSNAEQQRGGVSTSKASWKVRENDRPIQR